MKTNEVATTPGKLKNPFFLTGLVLLCITALQIAVYVRFDSAGWTEMTLFQLIISSIVNPIALWISALTSIVMCFI